MDAKGKAPGGGKGANGTGSNHKSSSRTGSDAGAGTGPTGPGSRDSDGEPDLLGLAQAFGKELQAVGKQFKEVLDQVAEDAQYKFDQELAKALAKQPELYAEVRKTLRQIKRTADKAAEAFGLDDTK